MKAFAYFSFVFCAIFSVCLVVFFVALNAFYKNDVESPQIPHYMCLEGYELELDHDPPRCRHYLQRMIEADRKAEAELDLKRQKVTAELEKQRMERPKNETSNYYLKWYVHHNN